MSETLSYRIGWWTHRWWPNWVLIRCLITGRQPDGRRVPRRRYVETITKRARLIRRPHRPWQAETGIPDCSCNAMRAFTSRGAEDRVLRLHAKRMAAPLIEDAPVSGRDGKCWMSLTDEERLACR